MADASLPPEERPYITFDGIQVFRRVDGRPAGSVRDYPPGEVAFIVTEQNWTEPEPEDTEIEFDFSGGVLP